MANKFYAFALFLVLIGACEDDARSFMKFYVDPLSFAPQGYDGVRISLQTSNGRVTLTKDNFTEISGLALSDSIEVPNSGNAVVRLDFVEQGESIAGGEISIELRDATRWGVHLFRGVNDPSEDCLGCEGVARFAIRADSEREPNDAIWVMWGGGREGEVAMADRLEHQLLSYYNISTP